MINTSVLTSIWLTEIEANIYICLLEKWWIWITDISKLSQCNRVQIYAALPRLKEMKLISESLHGKRKIFYAENPENLENIFYEQKLSFQNTVSLLKEKYEEKTLHPSTQSILYTRKHKTYIWWYCRHPRQGRYVLQI